MTIDMTFHLTYDREKDGTLGDFRDKYNKFADHVARLQALGHLPRGHVRWSIKHKRPDTPPPDGPAGPASEGRVVGFVPHSKPVLVHSQGERLALAPRMDPERIAV